MRSSFLPPLLALSLTATLAAGCFAPEIVVPPPPTPGPPVPVPPPPPPTDPAPPPPPPPTDGRENAGVLWLVRVDPATANLAVPYAQRVAALNAALERQGFIVGATVVASLYAQRVLWASGNPRSVDGLADVLAAAANAPASAPETCSTDALEALGANLVGVQPELAVTGDASRPFASRRSALLVAVLDHGPRPRAYTDAACLTADGTAADTFGEAPADVRWVNRSVQGGWHLPRVRTRFVFVTSSEDEAYDTMRARCAAVPGFPAGVQDLLAPSAEAFYGPWAADLGGRQAGLATRVDLCTALGSDFRGPADAIAAAWASALKAP